MQSLERYFDTAFSAPDGIERLRELILTLAVQGKLVSQRSSDRPARELLKTAAEEKRKLVKEGAIKSESLTAVDRSSEKPYALPPSWEWTTLGEIALVNPRNIAPDTMEVSFVPMAMIGSRFDEPHRQETRSWAEVKKGFTHFAEGDIAVAKITPCFENSKACVFSNLVNGLGAGTTELHVVRPLAAALSPRYVLAYLKSPRFLRVGATKMTGTAGQRRLPREFVESNPFPLPPIEEQERIVEKIDQLMARCDELERLRVDRERMRLAVHSAAIKQLLTISDRNGYYEALGFLRTNFGEMYGVKENVRELRKAILHLSTLGFLVPQDSNDAPACVLLEKIEQEKTRLIEEAGLRTTATKLVVSSEEFASKPEGWEYCRLGNLARFIDYRGKTPQKVDSGIPLITAKNVRFGFINRTPHEYVTEEEYGRWMTRGIPKVGDILFTTEAPLGNVALVDIKERFALAQRVICIQPHIPEMAEYLKWAMMSPPIQTMLVENATGMTATGIKAARLKEIPLPIPPLAEQRRIVQKIEQLMSLCRDLEDCIDAASTKQAELLDAAMALV